MVDMKMSEDEREEYNDTVMAKQPLYPYGLCIYLDDDALEKLGLIGEYLPKLDQVIEFKCKAQVVSVSARKAFDDDESSISLQITGMEVSEAESKDYAKSLYGGE